MYCLPVLSMVCGIAATFAVRLRMASQTRSAAAVIVATLQVGVLSLFTTRGVLHCWRCWKVAWEEIAQVLD